MTTLHHWHQTSDDPAVFQPPPDCCRTKMDQEMTALRTDKAQERAGAVHDERVRVVTALLDAIELYAAQAGSLLTNEQSKDMLGLIAGRMADVVRKTGCICPRINVTSFSGQPAYLAGRHARCGMHDVADTNGRSGK